MQTASCASSSRRVSSISNQSKVLSSKTNWQSAIANRQWLGPLQRTLAPGVVIAHNQNSYEDKHFDQGKLGERKILTHKNDGPWQQKDCLDIENQKQHRHDVVTHREAIVRTGFRIDAALVRPHLVFPIFPWSQKTAENDRKNGEGNRKNKKDHHRQIRRAWSANGVRSCGGL